MAQLTDSFSLWIFSTSRYSSIPFGVIRDTWRISSPEKSIAAAAFAAAAAASCCISTPQFFLIFSTRPASCPFPFRLLSIRCLSLPGFLFQKDAVPSLLPKYNLPAPEAHLTDPVRSEPLPDCPVSFKNCTASLFGISPYRYAAINSSITSIS